jgi:hypothetical protein
MAGMSLNNAGSDGVSFESLARCEQRMSAWLKAEERTVTSMSAALFPKADIKRRNALFNNLVDTGKDRRRYGETERLGGLQVDHQFEFACGLHRQVSGLFAFKNAIDVARRLPVLIDRVRPIADQATIGYERAVG